MSEHRAGTVLRLDAVLTRALGALLVLGSWDGLYAAGANAGAALIIAAWLIFRGKIDLEVGTQGIVELVIAAVVLGVLALAEAAIARSRAANTA